MPYPFDENATAPRPARARPGGRPEAALFGVPRLSRLNVPRTRALTALDEAAAEPLCVVHAPTGYGKTTLLAQWVRARARRDDDTMMFWITVDRSCDTRMSFWQAVFGLIAESGAADDIGLTLIEPAGDIVTSLPSLIERSFTQLRRPIVLVIDAWENIVDELLCDDLLRIVRHADDVRVVLGTRTLPREMVTAAAPHGASVLGVDDLRFGPDELTALCRSTGVHLSPKEIVDTLEATEGWALAQRTLLAALKDDHLHFELTGTETLDALRSQLVDEARRLDGYDFVLRTSVAETLTDGLAQWLGAEPGEMQVLDELQSRGLGTWEGTPAPRFRLLPLLREGLQLRMEPVARGRAHRRLALWHERHDDIPAAFFSALDAEDAELAVAFAQRAFIPITVALQRRPEMLTRQRRAFFAREPLLSLLNGVAHNIAGNTRQAMQRFVTTIALSQARLMGRSGSPDPGQVWVQAALTSGLRLVGRYELVESSFRRFRRMLETARDPLGSLQSAHELFTNESAVTLIYLDRLDEARPLLADELELPENDRHRHHYYPAALGALIEALDGRFDAVSHITDRLERDGLPRQFDASFYAVPLHLAHAYALLEHHRFDDATARLEWCMLHWKTIEMWPLLVDVEVRAEWQRSTAGAALRLLDERLAEKRSAAPISPAMTALLDSLRAELLVAATVLTDAHALAPMRRYRTRHRLAVPRALAFLVGGQPHRALGIADALVDAERLHTRQRVELELIAASALLRIGDADAASARFAPAAELALESGLRLPFTKMRCGDARTLAVHHIKRQQIERILDELPVMFPAVGDEPTRLTRREEVVLARLATVETLPQIAETLSVSVNTVKSQARAVYRKLGVSGRDDAVAEARRRGLL